MVLVPGSLVEVAPHLSAAMAKTFCLSALSIFMVTDSQAYTHSHNYSYKGGSSDALLLLHKSILRPGSCHSFLGYLKDFIVHYAKTPN